MVQPIDYSIDVQTPFQAALQGYQSGAAIRTDIQQQQQQQAARAQQAQMQADIASLGSNPSPQAIAGLSVRYPQLSEQFKRSYDMLSSEQQKNRLSSAIPIYAAIQSGRKDIAAQKLEEQASAYENSGQQQEAAQARAMARLVTDHPEVANQSFGLILASTLGPDKFAETFGKLGEEQRAQDKAPAELLEANAKASSAATAAKFAESKAVQDLRMGDEQIKKWAADTEIARQNSRIAAMNASISREGNDLKRQELGLKVQEAITARDDKLRTKVAEVESARSNIDNLLNTADRILKTDRGVIDSAAGPVSSRLPTISGDTADLEALVETLGSQAFLSQIPAMKGTGSLTEREGDKLQAALTNLSLKQSPERLLTNVREAQRLMIKARKNLAVKYGVPESVPDTPDAQPSGNEVDDLVKRYAP